MAMTFDTTMKDMARADPPAFLATFDVAVTRPFRLLNADLSTVTNLADLVIGLGAPLEKIIHIDFQSAANATKHNSLMVYNAVLHDHHLVPVHTIVILLRPQAAHSNMNGAVRYTARAGRGKNDFEYEVVRLWEWPAARLLNGPLGTLPLALLGRLPEGVPVPEGMRFVAERIMERLRAEASPERARKLFESAYLLAGLRVRRNEVRQVFQGARPMRESDTVLEFIEEGQEEKVKSIILRVGQKKFGSADDSRLAQLNAIKDLERLDRIVDRLFEDAASWQDLLDTP